MVEREGKQANGALKSRLSLFQAAVLLIAGSGASGGIYSLWAFAFGTSGPAFAWNYVVIGAGVFLICLVWAELASHYPFAGSFYEWPRLVLGDHRARHGVAWWIGWIYLFGLTFTLTSIYLAIANDVIVLFGWTSSTTLVIVIALVSLVLCFVINASGIERVGKFGMLGIIGEFIAVGVIITATLIFSDHSSPSHFFSTSGQGPGNWMSGFLGAALFMPIWALYTFEGAGLLGEETKNARRAAPKAILIALAVTVAEALYIIVALVLSTPDPIAAMSSENPIKDVIDAALPSWAFYVFLVIMIEVLLLSATTIMTYASRQLFGMARAGEMPATALLSRVTGGGIPWVSLVIVAAISAIPIIISSDVAVVVGGCTAVAYVAYAAVLAVVLIGRSRGWPKSTADFSLRRWSWPVSIAAFLVAAAILLNLLWPRDSTNPEWHGLRASYWTILIPVVVGIVVRFFVPKRHHRDDLNPVDSKMSTLNEGV